MTLLQQVGALKDAPEREAGKNKAAALKTERKALLGYVRGNLCPNHTYELQFGMQANDRPMEANAVRLLAASMDGATERYSSRSFIKIPIDRGLLTASGLAKVQETRSWNLDMLYEFPEQLEKLANLEELLREAYHKTRYSPLYVAGWG